MIDHDFVFRNIFRGVPISPFFLHIYTEWGSPDQFILAKSQKFACVRLCRKNACSFNTVCLCVCVARQERIPRRISRVKKKVEKVDG